MTEQCFRASFWSFFFVGCSAVAGVVLASLPVMMPKMSKDYFWLIIPLGIGWAVFSLLSLQSLRRQYVRLGDEVIEIGGCVGVRCLKREDIQSVGMYAGLIYLVLRSGEVVNLPVIYRQHTSLFVQLKN